MTEDLKQKYELTIMPAAVENAIQMLKERNLEGNALRIYAAGSPTAFNYGLAIEANVREEDLKWEYDGLTVIVDEFSIEYVDGVIIDYEVSDDGGGFTIANPKMVANSPAYSRQGKCSGGGCASGCGSGSSDCGTSGCSSC